MKKKQQQRNNQKTKEVKNRERFGDCMKLCDCQWVFLFKNNQQKHMVFENIFTTWTLNVTGMVDFDKCSIN